MLLYFCLLCGFHNQTIEIFDWLQEIVLLPCGFHNETIETFDWLQEIVLLPCGFHNETIEIFDWLQEIVLMPGSLDSAHLPIELFLYSYIYFIHQFICSRASI